MHLVMYYTYWTTCVMVGLDWAEPMMQFLLHITCSCIPHAYILYFQYTCYIWIALGLFWLSFSSLSLSLLFTLVVSMAPKRKSTPSQNLLRSGASSSSDPTPSHIRFRDENARKYFSKNFSQQGVHSERWVILADFVDTDLPTVIHSQGWESLVHSCWSRSFTPTCMDLIFQYLSFLLVFEVHAL